MAKELDFKGKKNFIRAHLVAEGIKLTDIAKELGVAVPTVSQVIAGIRTSRRIQLAIARKLNMAPEELWPRFNNKGNREKSKYQKGRKSR